MDFVLQNQQQIAEAAQMVPMTSDQQQKGTQALGS